MAEGVENVPTWELLNSPVPQPVPMQARVVSLPQWPGHVVLLIEDPTGTRAIFLEPAHARQIGAGLVEAGNRAGPGLVVAQQVPG